MAYCFTEKFREKEYNSTEQTIFKIGVQFRALVLLFQAYFLFVGRFRRKVSSPRVLLSEISARKEIGDEKSTATCTVLSSSWLWWGEVGFPL